MLAASNRNLYAMLFKVALTSHLCNIEEALFCWFEFITSAKKREFKVAFRLNNKRENSRVEIGVDNIFTLKPYILKNKF